MNSSTVRLSALLLSLGLTLLSQLPVVTAEHGSSSSHPAALQAVGTVSETSTVFDARENLWKRWSMETINGKRVVALSTSADGNIWSVASKTCFTPSLEPEAWDHSSIGSPIIVENKDATSDDRRFMMWYSGASDSTTGSGVLAPTSIGLAFSSDGRHFTRLPASESAAGKEGLVLSGKAAFPNDPSIAQASVGEPRISIADEKYTMSFFRVGTNEAGVVQAAGLGAASSTDGIKWTLQTGAPVTVELVGKTRTTPALVHRLRQLVDAYAECPM